MTFSRYMRTCNRCNEVFWGTTKSRGRRPVCEDCALHGGSVLSLRSHGIDIKKAITKKLYYKVMEKINNNDYPGARELLPPAITS